MLLWTLSMSVFLCMKFVKILHFRIIRCIRIELDIRVLTNPDMDYNLQIRRIYGPDPVLYMLFGYGSGSSRSGPDPVRLQA